MENIIDNPPLTQAVAAQYLGVAEKTLIHWRYVSSGPKYFKLGSRIIYRKPDLEKFLESCAVEPTLPTRRPNSSGNKINLDGAGLPFSANQPARRRGRPSHFQQKNQ